MFITANSHSFMFHKFIVNYGTAEKQCHQHSKPTCVLLTHTRYSYFHLIIKLGLKVALYTWFMVHKGMQIYLKAV